MTPDQYNGIIFEIRLCGITIMIVIAIFHIAGRF